MEPQTMTDAPPCLQSAVDTLDKDLFRFIVQSDLLPLIFSLVFV